MNRIIQRTVILLLLRQVVAANGSVALKEPQLLGAVLVDVLNAEVQETTSAASVDNLLQEVSIAGRPVETEPSTVSVNHTVQPRDLTTATPTMDLITIIWYLATLVALVSFFVVMACADTNKCFSPKPPDVEIPVPPTPAPSYRLFAPPSYESVVAKSPESIFIIPMSPYERRDNAQFAENLMNNLASVIDSAASVGAYSSDNMNSTRSDRPPTVMTV